MSQQIISEEFLTRLQALEVLVMEQRIEIDELKSYNKELSSYLYESFGTIL